MASSRALIIAGALIGLMASPIPLYLGSLSLLCACGQCADPLPAYLVFPIPFAAYHGLSLLPGASSVAPFMLLALALAQYPAYASALVAGRLGLMPSRSLLVLIGVHLAFSLLVLGAFVSGLWR